MSYVPTIEDIADTIASATKGEAPSLEDLRVLLEGNDGEQLRVPLEDNDSETVVDNDGEPLEDKEDEPIVDGPPTKQNVYKLVAAAYALIAELDQASDDLRSGNNRDMVQFVDEQRVLLRARMEAVHNWLWKHRSAEGPRLAATFESLKSIRDDCKSVLRTVRR
ncbi:hypothetical protein MAPG_00200 [Magnaporthiopsis poae ATCC 64411]|uniref:Uncharacterized protein n=1 Tax=Magnaporthiopsis poae (strain ATCC 64411 / 73-15) TaxID=644358 RepID=A0A0C4DKD2_MAGP6|nr:hypothetical protein MAPG_00200 [Magnaporthiopsis poae ATCC 64411]